MPSRKIEARILTSSYPTFMPSQRYSTTSSDATQERSSSSQNGLKRTGGRGYGLERGLGGLDGWSISQPIPYGRTTSFASSGLHFTPAPSYSSSYASTEATHAL